MSAEEAYAVDAWVEDSAVRPDMQAIQSVAMTAVSELIIRLHLASIGEGLCMVEPQRYYLRRLLDKLDPDGRWSPDEAPA